MKKEPTTHPVPSTFVPYTGSVRLSQEQLRIRRIMLAGNSISWDGQYATLAHDFVNIQTFFALLRKGIIRYSPRRFQYVLVETNPGKTGLYDLPGRKKLDAVRRVQALQRDLGLTDSEMSTILFDIAGQMRTEFLGVGDCAKVMRTLEVRA